MFCLHVGTELLKDINHRMPWSPVRKHPFAHTVGVEPAPNRQSVAQSRRTLMELVPSLRGVRIRQAWAAAPHRENDAF